MRVLVYPHDLAIGGSQLNAIEIAAAMRDLGVDPVIFGQPGTLDDRIAELGLERIDSVSPGRRPSPAVARQLRSIIESRDIDLVHGYEWPPTLELAMATIGTDLPVVSTVMSMDVARFIPHPIPLVVGTAQIAARERTRGRRSVHLIEPPVDLEHNQPADAQARADFRRRWQLDESLPLVVIVCRLVPDLKLEGILTAIRVVGGSCDVAPFQLLIVGDGPAWATVRQAADDANTLRGRRAVVLTGELTDPREAYDAADICVGMGGSALRSMAFGKPLVVQGEHGYFRALDNASEAEFRWRGWYGVGPSVTDGDRQLADALAPLLTDVQLRDARARLGLSIVQDFALTEAASAQLRIYREALGGRTLGPANLTAAAASVVRFADYKLRRAISARRGTRRTDDFNAAPSPSSSTAEIAAPASPVPSFPGTLLYFPGVSWDGVRGTDRNLAEALSRDRDVIWVDPPTPWRPRRGTARTPRVSTPHPRIARLHTVVPPGVTKPGFRQLATWLNVRAAKAFVREIDEHPQVVLASCTEPVLKGFPNASIHRVYYGTDDFVAAASLWGISARYLHRAREANLACSTTVLAVSRELASVLRRSGSPPRLLPNGFDASRPGRAAEVKPHRAIARRSVAGVVGQFNERTDIDLLREVADAELSMLLVGPVRFGHRDAEARFAALLEHPAVTWIDHVPADELPAYVGSMSVGLVPYSDSPFNRSCSPLKTFEYLAAGLPVVTSRAAEVVPHGCPYVIRADPGRFADEVLRLSQNAPDPDSVREFLHGHSWYDRVRQFDDIVAGLISDAGTS